MLEAHRQRPSASWIRRSGPSRVHDMTFLNTAVRATMGFLSVGSARCVAARGRRSRMRRGGRRRGSAARVTRTQGPLWSAASERFRRRGSVDRPRCQGGTRATAAAALSASTRRLAPAVPQRGIRGPRRFPVVAARASRPERRPRRSGRPAGQGSQGSRGEGSERPATPSSETLRAADRQCPLAALPRAGPRPLR
jgi:hypothetical protein